jgi:hypothetical protein
MPDDSLPRRRRQRPPPSLGAAAQYAVRMLEMAEGYLDAKSDGESKGARMLMKFAREDLEAALVADVATARRSLRELVLAGLGHDANGYQLDGACRALEMLLDCLSGPEPDFPGALPRD